MRLSYALCSQEYSGIIGRDWEYRPEVLDAGVTDGFISWLVDHPTHRFSDPTELIPSMEEAMDVTGAPSR